MIKVGEILPYAALTAPRGFLVCDGSAVSRATYSSLFSVIGTAFGVGDGSTTFNLPNLKGRVAVGYKSSDTDFDTVGKTGGASTISLAHSHTQNAHTHNVSGTTGTSAGQYVYAGASTSSYQHTHTFGVTASGAMSNAGTNSQLSATQSVLNPFISLNFIIRYQVGRSDSFVFFAFIH